MALWGVFILGTWLLASAPTAEDREEERQLARFCERYEELRDQPFEQIRDELDRLKPTTDAASIEEWLTFCEDG